MASISSLAIFTAVLLRHWNSTSLAILVVSATAAAINAIALIMIGDRLPLWALHVDVGIGNLFLSLVVIVGESEHIDLSNLYLLVAFFAFLYLPLRSAFGHFGMAGASYALILGLGPREIEAPVISWLAVFGTAAALGVVVVGLVSVLRLSAREDPLTGLPNRRSWDERLAEEVARAQRTGTELSIVMIDLDDFKTINDSSGHLAGDNLLQTLANSWKRALRDGGDFVARLGGDEFAVLAPGTDEVGVQGLLKRLRHALPKGLSASFGVATWNRTESAGGLLLRADQAMYDVKQSKGTR